MSMIPYSVGRESADIDHRDRARKYFDDSNQSYLKYLGTTLQAALVKTGSDVSAKASNLYLASQAGIQPGDCVLDAGCGVCGPCVDIAQTIAEVNIHAITISLVQARTATGFVQQAGAADRVRVCVGDYHNLPYPDAFFDVVLFFESVSHSDDHQQLFSATFRVLRPGGKLYIKDIFVDDQILSEQSLQALEEVNRVYAARLTTVNETKKAISGTGFQDVDARNLNDIVSIEHWIRAFINEGSGRPTLTEFGKIHSRKTQDIPAPVLCAEIKARKPDL